MSVLTQNVFGTIQAITENIGHFSASRPNSRGQRNPQPVADLGGMQPANPSDLVTGQAARVSDGELTRQIDSDTGRHGGRIIEEGAEETNGAKLDREA